MNIQRINELTQISRERELTPEEQAERQKLRQEYLQAFRSSFRQQLDHTVVQYPDGNKVPLKDVNKK
ncbi:MAG: DUF896 domain-containing protein [Clostridia bacterium]|nr:DUF896 domain-containing protein [Clostridia bacterium]